METRRTELVIVAEILKLGINGAGVTRMMYRSNLNHARTKHYLALLEDKGLLVSRSHSGNRVFLTSDRGRKALRHLEEAIDILGISLPDV